jgi:hypothetical protein
VTEAPRKIVMTPTADWTELAMVAGVQPLPFSSWAFAGYPGFDVCQRLLLEESAITEADLLLVEHTAIARLTAAEAAKLNLPPLTTLRAVIEGSGVMLRPEFSVKLR